MKNLARSLLLVGAFLLAADSASAQNHLMAEGAHYAMSQEPPLYLRADGYDYDHEILVALPATYNAFPNREYPVLWAMDGALLFDLTVGMVSFYSAGNRFPEMIVVGVGHRREEGMAGLMKRTTDLFPTATMPQGLRFVSAMLSSLRMTSRVRRSLRGQGPIEHELGDGLGLGRITAHETLLAGARHGRMFGEGRMFAEGSPEAALRSISSMPTSPSILMLVPRWPERACNLFKSARARPPSTR